MQERDKPCYLTPEGKAKLLTELEDLRTVRRPAIAERIHELNGYEGSMEDSELEDAMSDQNKIDMRIRDIEYMLKRAIMIDNSANGDLVQLGSHVTVKDGTGEEICWMIVSSAEASARQGKISSDSLVGAALLGHHEGDAVQVKAPAGVEQFTILKVY